MSDTFNSPETRGKSNRNWQIALWVAQILTAGLYGLSGIMKISMDPQNLAGMGLAYAPQIPHALLVFIGTCEALGAIGVIAPAATRIKPWLTPLAATGFVLLQVLAFGFHIMRGESVIALNYILLLLPAFIVWGRTKKLPIVPR